MMRKSLWLKLMGVFVLVILIGVLATIFIINVSVVGQFQRFVYSGDRLQAQELANVLANYYARERDWDGVEVALGSATPMMMGGMMGGMSAAEMEQMMRRGMMGGMTTAEMVEMMRWDRGGLDRVVLVDEAGVVVADTAGDLVGRRLSPDRLENGQPILVDGRQVGTVLVGTMIEPTLSPLDEDFLRAVNRAVLLGALTTGALALVLGSLLFFQITRPVREVTDAAEALAAGDLSQRAEVRSEDEIGRLAAAFNRMAEALARQEKLRRNMISDIAHELRTPLTLLQGNLEAMLDGYYELSRENIAALHQDVLMMARLVNDLRVLSMAEAGQLSLLREQVDAADMVARVSESFRAQADEKDVRLATEIDADVPPVMGDEQRLAQVLSNILANALRHTPAGGEVRVRCKKTKAPDQDGRTREWVQISVVDTGEGISSDDLPYVFERFYRADKSRSRAAGGAGLGLAIAKQLVEAHGGRIWAESEGPGRGSAFTFILPLQEI
ncbi:MAG: HAMP domain-containing protein [Chloroflexi bacterium]|nr:HAMP domain-containing protein [Chloroflexota bacterium]